MIYILEVKPITVCFEDAFRVANSSHLVAGIIN